VPIATETVAEIMLGGEVRLLGANDAARSSFTAWAGNSLVAVDPSLNVLGRWPAGRRHRGHHATYPGGGLALISGPDEVRLLDHAGRALWRYEHPPWSGAFESGCTWFGEGGQPYAVVPATSYDHCLVLRLDLDSGQPLARAPIEARPAGIIPVHHPDGWVGLSEGEGQDAARTWWVWSATQSAGRMPIEILKAGWDDWILSDVDSSGTKIITTPHMGWRSPLMVRSFPGLDIVRSVDPPPGESWNEAAFFADDMIVNALSAPEHSQRRLVAISRRGKICDLDEHEDRWPRPAVYGTWLTAHRGTIRLRKMARSDEEIPGQMALW